MLCALQEHFSKRLASYLCMYIDEIYIHTTDEGGFFKMSRTSENLESLNEKKHIYIAYMSRCWFLCPLAHELDQQVYRWKRKPTGPKEKNCKCTSNAMKQKRQYWSPQRDRWQRGQSHHSVGSSLHYLKTHSTCEGGLTLPCLSVGNWVCEYV